MTQWELTGPVALGGLGAGLIGSLTDWAAPK
jgi:hypothetical protein